MSNRQPGRPMKARPRILETACVLFLQQGLDISLDEIANEAGTTRQTLYNHFPSKDALVLETFNHLIEKMQPPIAAILAQESMDLPQVLARFASVVQAHFFSVDNVHFQRLMVQLLLQKPELHATLRERNAGRVLQAFVKMLEQARQHGQVQFADAQPQAMAFLGAVMGYPLPAALLSDQWPMPEQLQQMAEAAITAFLLAWRYSPPAITE